MTQLELIEIILKDVGIDNTSKKHDTPSLKQPLLKHESSEPATDEEWQYRSVFGKL